MDGDAVSLRKKLDELLREAAEVSVALDRTDGTIEGVPHYSAIEARAHQLGQRLSREIQQRRMAEIVGAQATKGTCPGCGRRCALAVEQRTVTSADGAVELRELKGYCPSCRKSFFPAARDAGL